MNFFYELWVRLTSKSPVFFVVIQAIAAIGLFLTGLPLLLTTFQNDIPITLPDWVHAMSNKAATVGLIIGWIIARLPVKTEITSTKTLTGKKLPFTAKHASMFIVALFCMVTMQSCFLFKPVTKADPAQKQLVIQAQSQADNIYFMMAESRDYSFSTYSSMYLEVTTLIDSIKAVDSRRVNPGKLLKIDDLLQSAWNKRVLYHSSKTYLTPAQAKVERAYMRSFWDARVLAEMSIK